MNILNLQTYGKLSLPKRTILEIGDRFRINPLIENIFQEKGLGIYVPKLNKTRFIFSLVLALIFIALPFVTILSLPTLAWGIRK